MAAIAANLSLPNSAVPTAESKISVAFPKLARLARLARLASKFWK
tara:strand:- start:2706 stop:2840 length:135 start_codon:yes stop_codon:yes gene_type:complete